MIDIQDSHKNWTLLHKAINMQDYEVASILLECGAKIDIPDIDGRTPYYMALEKKFHPGIALLKKHGADAGIVTKFGSLLHVAVSDEKLYYSNSKHFKWIIETLISDGVDVNTRDKQGRTSLHVSTTATGTTFLLQMKANINAKDNDGNSPLQYAIRDNRSEVVDILLSQGANVNCKNRDEESCLLLAVQSGNEGIVSSLLASNADLNVTHKGDSIIHSALKSRFDSIFELLVSWIMQPMDNGERSVKLNFCHHINCTENIFV